VTVTVLSALIVIHESIEFRFGRKLAGVREPNGPADGATSGGAGLRQAIFDYNHATWYVNEVLTLAAEYAREY